MDIYSSISLFVTRVSQIRVAGAQRAHVCISIAVVGLRRRRRPAQQGGVPQAALPEHRQHHVPPRPGRISSPDAPRRPRTLILRPNREPELSQHVQGRGKMEKPSRPIGTLYPPSQRLKLDHNEQSPISGRFQGSTGVRDILDNYVVEINGVFQHKILL